VILMGLKNLSKIAEVLMANGRPADTPVAVIQEATTQSQQSHRCTLATVPTDLRPPAVVVVGPVVDALSR
jgi:uroporphyrin-III C-methyltransferase / precorrin-2 dehydrogenase / sirohydrochlorin ferrochelatase